MCNEIAHCAAVKRGEPCPNEATAAPPWAMPSWMEPYRELIADTGGNSIEELYNDTTTNARNNLIRAALILAVKDQVGLLYRLHRKGWLVNLDDSALCGYCLHHADLHVYTRSRATDTGDVPCAQCPGGTCPRPMPPVRREPARCQALARKGGAELPTGPCDRLLDDRGQCDRPSSHIDL